MSKSAEVDAYIRRFPEPLPLALIARIVRFKVKQDLARMPKTAKKKK